MAGDCEVKESKKFMKENCPASCRRPYAKGLAFLDPDKDTSFFELEAKDAKGKLIDFERFAGYVTIVVDESSLCGFSTKDYTDLVRLHKAFPYLMEVIIFPTKQVKNENECSGIKEFKKHNGLDFLVMESVDINGPYTHPVYHYLKSSHYFDDLDPNYVTYFVIHPGGRIHVLEDVSPLFLIRSINDALVDLDE